MDVDESGFLISITSPLHGSSRWLVRAPEGMAGLDISAVLDDS